MGNYMGRSDHASGKNPLMAAAYNSSMVDAASTIYVLAEGSFPRPDASALKVACGTIPMKDEELSMSPTLSELAKRIESQPWNRPGTDKTWVLNAMSMHRQFRREVSQAKRVRTR
jgi:hypothetical protein